MSVWMSWRHRRRVATCYEFRMTEEESFRVFFNSVFRYVNVEITSCWTLLLTSGFCLLDSNWDSSLISAVLLSHICVYNCFFFHNKWLLFYNFSEIPYINLDIISCIKEFIGKNVVEKEPFLDTIFWRNWRAVRNRIGRCCIDSPARPRRRQGEERRRRMIKKPGPVLQHSIWHGVALHFLVILQWNLKVYFSVSIDKIFDSKVII